MPRFRRAQTNSKDNSSWRKLERSTVVVTYRDGREVVDSRRAGEQTSHRQGDGLITRGTFGPILSTVVRDALRSEMAWDRWEQGGSGTLAVFHYRVPQNQSHYWVAFQDFSIGKADSTPPTGYHGEIAIDPATGTILRLTALADQPLGSPIYRADVMVEYGPVEIGGKTYTCPLRSVSVSLREGSTDPFNPSAATPAPTLLNDVVLGPKHLVLAEQLRTFCTAKA